MKTWTRIAIGAALTMGAVWTLLEFDPAGKRRAVERAWWS